MLQAKGEVNQKIFNYLTVSLKFWSQEAHPWFSDFQNCADVLACSSGTVRARAEVDGCAESSLPKEQNEPPTAAVSLTHAELYPVMLACS